VGLGGAPAPADASVGNFAMAVQPDGKIVVAGGGGPAPEGGKEFGAVARYLPNGGLDRSFGGGDGVVLMRQQQPFTAVALQRDGRIVLAAPIGEVVRLLPDGRFDGNFGVRGKKAAGVESSGYPTSIVIGAKGSIFVGGMTGYRSDNLEHWYGRLYRIAPSGLAGGWVGAMTSGDGREGEPTTVINDLVLGPGGSVVGAGSANARSLHPRKHAALARLIPGTVENGYPSGPDPSFGGGVGLVETDFFPGFSWEVANALSWQRGKLLIAGVANEDLLLARYTEDGILDNGFARRGFRTVTLGRESADFANALAVDAKGGILAAGGSTHNCGGTGCTSLLLARLGRDGHPVRSFGHGGILTPPIGSGTAGHPAYETAFEVAARPQGKILVGGLVGGPSGSRFFLRRYLADGTPDNSFGRRGRVTTLPVGVVGEHGVS
jgi:uncharacterized delta-60 repeat protein